MDQKKIIGSMQTAQVGDKQHIFFTEKLINNYKQENVNTEERARSWECGIRVIAVKEYNIENCHLSVR